MSGYDDTVHILIVTYNARIWLRVCCKGTEKLPRSWRVTLVDNASSDGTADTVEREYPHIRLIRVTENLGFGRANNLGLRLALDEGADYVYLLNQDAEISASGIAELIRLHKKYPECRIISPLHRNGDGSALDYSFARFCAQSGLEYLADCAEVQEDILFTDWGIAAGWLLPRASLLETGGFSPLFFHYGEDEDYVNRVRFHGGKVAVAPGVSMLHHRTEKTKKKTLDSRFIDRLIAMADPGLPAPPPHTVARHFARPVLRQLSRGNFSLASFLVRSCRELMRGDAPGSPRDAARRKESAFL